MRNRASLAEIAGVSTYPLLCHPVRCWSGGTLETLNKEREVIGLFLSDHPLRDYDVIIKNMCQTQLSELTNLDLSQWSREIEWRE